MKWNLALLEDIPRPHLVRKFQPKKIKSPFTCTCPKKLYCHKHKAGSLGVKIKTIQFFQGILGDIIFH